MGQILKRWAKMTKHETFNAIMQAGMAWGAIVAVLVYFTSEGSRLLVGALFTVLFWLSTTGYFYCDYNKTHKKRKPKITSPPLVEIPDSTKPTSPIKKVTIFRNVFFLILESIEAITLIAIGITKWEVITINGVAVLTYQNGVMLCGFVIGGFLLGDFLRRLSHPRKEILS